MDLELRAEALAQLIEDKLGLGGTGLPAKFARAGRRLPRHIHREGAHILGALQQYRHPKLHARIDQPRLDRAFDVIEQYLASYDAAAHRRGVVLDWLAAQAFNLIALAGLTVIILRWRGFV